MKSQYIGMRLTYFMLSVILLVYGLIIARDFLYPLAFGILLSYLLYPIVNFLEKKGFPRIFAILTGIVLAGTVFVLLGLFILKRISLFLDELPVFRERAITHIEQLQRYIESEFNIPAERFKNFLVTWMLDIGTESGKIFTTTTGTIFKILMLPVYIFLFLYYRTKFAYFYLKIVGRQNRMIAIGVLREISSVVTRYMLGVFTVVLILCFFNSIGYLLIGIKYSLLLGVISAFFSFIPYFGNFLGGIIPLIFALLTEDSSKYVFRIIVFVYIVHFVENNILSPNIVGDRIQINPFIIILGLIAGAMVWGIPGMLVIIPFLAMFKIVLQQVPGMQPYSFLLGTHGTRRHALTVENLKRFLYQIKGKLQGRKDRKK